MDGCLWVTANLLSRDRDRDRGGERWGTNTALLPRDVQQRAHVTSLVVCGLFQRIAPACWRWVRVLNLDATGVDHCVLEQVVTQLVKLQQLSLRFCPNLTVMDILETLFPNMEPHILSRRCALPALETLCLEHVPQNSMTRYEDTCETVRTLERCTAEQGIRMDVASCQFCQDRIVARRLIAPCRSCQAEIPACFACSRENKCALCFEHVCSGCQPHRNRLSMLTCSSPACRGTMYLSRVLACARCRREETCRSCGAWFCLLCQHQQKGTSFALSRKCIACKTSACLGCEPQPQDSYGCCSSCMNAEDSE